MPESQEGEKAKQSIPLNIICSQLGTVCFKQAVKRSIQNNNNNEIIEQLLSELKVRKTTNYKTFKKHVEQQLTNLPSLSIQQFVSSFINIGKLMNRIGNKKHQTFALFEGYKIYFTNTRKLNQNTQYFIEEMLKSFMEISYELAEEVGKYLFQLWQSIKNQTEYNASEHALSIVKKYVERGLKGHEGKQCLALVYYFNLFNRFDDEVIVSWIVNENVRQIIYGFLDEKKEVRKPLIRAYIKNKLPEGLKDIKTMIGILRLNAEEFPQLLQAVNRKKLNFFYTHFSLFFLELKFTNRPDLIAMLAQMYIDQNKRSEAIHLINKFQLEQLYDYRGEEKSYQSNPLLELDSFLPTQCIVKNDKPEEYITLKQLGYKIKDVLVIDKMGDVDRAIEVIDRRCKMGIDCEFISSITGYEEKKVALTQLATKSEVFLF